MARFYPPEIDRYSPSSEKTTWRSLEALSDQWRVFHGVRWQVPKADRQFDGEADFVLLHPNHGMIVLEVKGGSEIWVEDGAWFRTSPDGTAEPMQDPYAQAKNAMYDLGSHLERAVPGVGGIPAGRAVVFPFVTAPTRLGPGAPAAETFGRDELRLIEPAIERLIDHARLDTRMSSTVIDAITAHLAPTERLRIRLSSVVAEAGERLIELTRQQTRLLGMLRHQRRVLISGGAGTGKTILAIEQARRLADLGERVLFTCFNRPLADHVADRLADTPVRVASFHQLIHATATEAGLTFPHDPDPDWWNHRAPSLLTEAAEILSLQFDAVVIDEGQDFLPAWFTSLELLLADPGTGPMHVFYDERQTIYRDSWEPPFPGDPFVLDQNCRNTLPIARRVAAVIDHDEPSDGADGPSPMFTTAGPDRAMATVERLVDDLIIEGVAPDQIAVISDRSAVVTDLRSLASGRFCRIGETGVVAETIHRFKGLEADVVVVVLSGLEDAKARSLAYIGMSRARSLLHVVGPRSVRTQLNW